MDNRKGQDGSHQDNPWGQAAPEVSCGPLPLGLLSILLRAPEVDPNEPHPCTHVLHGFQLGSASGALATDHGEGGEGGQMFVALAITLECQLWCPSPSTKVQCSSRESLCPRASLLSCGLVPPLVLLAWGHQNSTASIPGFLAPVCPHLGK